MMRLTTDLYPYYLTLKESLKRSCSNRMKYNIGKLNYYISASMAFVKKVVKNRKLTRSLRLLVRLQFFTTREIKSFALTNHELISIGYM